jgi:hypothetical protein
MGGWGDGGMGGWGDGVAILTVRSWCALPLATSLGWAPLSVPARATADASAGAAARCAGPAVILPLLPLLPLLPRSGVPADARRLREGVQAPGERNAARLASG